MSPPRAAAGRGAALAGTAALVALTGILHGPSLRFGLFLDDRAHYRQLRDADWSLRGLTDACRLELVGGEAELWWLPECTLRFFRPVSFALLKALYTAGGWDPLVPHAGSLGLHLLAALLLAALLRRCDLPSGPAWIAAVLFAVHPGHVATVQWIACQTELLTTVLLLAATLCLPVTARGALWRCALALALYAAALGCRENAVVWPAAALVALRQSGGAPRRATTFLLAGAAVLAGAYAVLRSSVLGGAALPPPPYVIPPGHPEFVRFCADKALYYLLGEFLLYPCVPIGGLPWLRAHPLAFYLPAALLLAVLGGLGVALRRHPAVRLGSVWLAVFLLPVLPVFAAPHHLYLPGVGWALWTGLLLDRLDRLHGPAARPRFVRFSPAGLRRVLLAAAAAGIGAPMAALSVAETMVLDAAQRVEDMVIEEIGEEAGPLRPGDTIYYANMPLIAHYLKTGLELRSNVRGLRVVSLTPATRLLGMAAPAELRWTDDRTIEIDAGPRQRYLSGPLRRLVRAAGGPPLRPGRSVRAADLTVHVLEADGQGVRRLRIEFDHPLRGAGRHLFWGSPYRWAWKARPPDAEEGSP